jgi:hypothetical protein
MKKQLEIDWLSVPHARENNKVSQENLDANRFKFRGQAATVLTLLQKSVKLTPDLAKEIYGIRHLARRIGDLGEGKRLGSEFCVDIDREWECINGEKGNQYVYFLPENRTDFIAKGWILNKLRWWYSTLYTPPQIRAKVDELNKK